MAISAGELHSVALKSDGTVVCWGNNDSGQIDVPEGLENVVTISAGSYHTLALVDPEEKWGPFSIVDEGSVFTGSWIGWLWVGDAPWVWSYSLKNWIYMEDPVADVPGAWGYFLK